MCCQSVAALLPVLLPLKCLPDNRVTDVATFGSAFNDMGWQEFTFRPSFGWVVADFSL
jgi:hypothetical protein